MAAELRRARARARVWRRRALIAIGMGYLALLVGLPLANVFWQAFAQGAGAFWRAITAPEAVAAQKLTLLVLALVVPLNTAFGLTAAWILARRPSPAQRLLGLALDVPLAISPTIVGLLIVMVYSPTVGLLAPWIATLHVKVLFAWPGLVLSTLFVTLPFVAREVLPALYELDPSEEEAAAVLGATRWQTFRQVIVPSIRWSIVYGVVLCTAKAVGEFGAASVVSGKLIGETNTLTLHVERAYMEYENVPAFACSAVVAALSLGTLALQALLPRTPARR